MPFEHAVFSHKVDTPIGGGQFTAVLQVPPCAPSLTEHRGTCRNSQIAKLFTHAQLLFLVCPPLTCTHTAPHTCRGQSLKYNIVTMCLFIRSSAHNGEARRLAVRPGGGGGENRSSVAFEEDAWLPGGGGGRRGGLGRRRLADTPPTRWPALVF